MKKALEYFQNRIIENENKIKKLQLDYKSKLDRGITPINFLEWKKIYSDEISLIGKAIIILNEAILSVEKVCDSPKDYICNVNDNGICKLPTKCVYQRTLTKLINS